MDKIYMDAKDKNVAKVVIYTTDNGTGMQVYGAYVNPECTKLFTDEGLEDAFLKGALVKIMNMGGMDSYLVPNAFYHEDGVSTILIQVVAGEFMKVSTLPKGPS